VTSLTWPRKPDIDERSYCYFRIADNDLRVLLVRDPEADRAAASMSVGVGHLQDPDDCPGLAHFCEHMCFLGSDKYPDEGAYHEHIARHGGHANAFTSLEETNYAFEISPEHLIDTLDRFAQCFLHPRFHQSAVRREVQAVDAEYRMNRQSDVHRLFQLLKSLADPEHPFYKFGTGSQETLLGVAAASPEGNEAGFVKQQQKLCETLQRFHRQYYGADHMCLCVSFTAHQTMDEMTTAILDLFGQVPRAQNPLPAAAYSSRPLFQPGAEPMGQLLIVEPVKALREMRVVFAIPPQRSQYRSKPANCLAHLLGHESRGSLLAALKHRGWATALSAGVSQEIASQAFFEIEISLTERGLFEWQWVLSTLHDYLGMVRATLGKADDQNDLPACVYEELETLGEIHFRYQERESSPFQAVVEHSSSLRWYAPEDVLAGPYLYFDRPTKQQLQNLLLEYLHIKKAITFLICREMYERPENFALDPSTLRPGHEPWYDTNYLSGPLPADAWTRSGHEGAELHLPLPNPFLPRCFTLKTSQEAKMEATASNGLQPRCLLRDESSGQVLHHCLDTSFRQPRIQALFQLYTDMAYASPEQALLTKLAICLIEDDLMPSAYDAELAGMSYTISPTAFGVLIGLSGFSDSFERFTEHVFRTAANAADRSNKGAVNGQRLLLEAHLDRLRRAYENMALQKPYQQVLYHARVLLQVPHWHARWDYLPLLADESEETAQRFCWERVDAFRRAFFAGETTSPAAPRRELLVEALIHGNITSKEAETLFQRCMAILQPYKAPTNGSIRALQRQLAGHQLRIPSDKSPLALWVPLTNPAEVNSGFGCYLQTGLGSLEADLLLELVASLLQKPLFHELRTVQQLGYVVSGFVYRLHGAQGLFIVLQSTERYSPWHVAERLERFLQDFTKTEMKRLEPRELVPYLEAMAEKREERDRNLVERAARWWTEIERGTYAYDRTKREAQYLRRLLEQNAAQAQADADPTPDSILAHFLQQLHDFWNKNVLGRQQGGSLRIYAVPTCWAASLDKSDSSALVKLVATQEQEYGLETPSPEALVAEATACRAWQTRANCYPSERERGMP
jgi:insulysin